MTNKVTRFLKKNCIREDIALNDYIIEAINTLELACEIANRYSLENIESLKDKAVWSIIYDIYTRSYKYTEATLSLFIISHIASSEALCRTSVESSVNLYYLSIGNDVENVISYFKDHIKNERQQNKKWREAVNNSDESQNYKSGHIELIDKKEKSLDFYEKMLTESFSIINIDYDTINSNFPTTFDRFKKINKEVTYRTLYAALCSQSHNDAEDSINNLMARIVQKDGMETGVEAEKYIFSLYMVLNCIQLWIEATIMFLEKYEIKMSDELFDVYKRASMNIITLDENKSEFIKNAMKNQA
jgi:predicted transcriptional regulator